MNFNESTITDCRERDGQAAEREAEIDEIIQTAELGRGEGEPLAAESYSAYPQREELTDPKNRSFLTELLSHELVNSIEDAAEECAENPTVKQRWNITLRKAVEVFGIDLSDYFGDYPDETNRLKELLGFQPPDSMIAPSNVLVVSELYVAGLSVGEIVDVLADHTVADTQSVEDTLKKAGLISGTTTQEQASAFEENDGRIGGTSVETETGETEETRGLTVSANDF
ncbi:hypothetical protein [Haloarcula sp. Atlit-7R]|uniref:hypothetical protein n=1 Tax=Haloarcula sp. Atlit-7R TaxID=2282125 RepID=UPI000EF172F2|nr:hypothetical protein [Haloarcula sp. Atlit-7R]RLM95815.1 hypothetical protein D3D01_10580 [Haloarcula sp. Atlit-7R]